MLNFKLFLIITIMIPKFACAQEFAKRVAEIYRETDSHYDIGCHYSLNKTFKLIRPVTETVKSSNSLKREFIIETDEKKISLAVVLRLDNRSIRYVALIDGSHISSGELAEHEFKLAPLKDQIINEKFEIPTIVCQMNFAYAYPYPLSGGKYHFNIHPHTIYDDQARLKSSTERYLNDDRYRSIIFLETDNFRGNLVSIFEFMNGTSPSLPENNLESDLTKVPSHTPLIVSPAGNNRFTIAGDETIEITFTGGNHNYCMWNNTRQVLMALLNSNSRAKIVFNYDMSSIVAQKGGMEELDLSFESKAINTSNLLKDLLNTPAIQERYHFSWLVYFRNLLAQEYSGMYQTFRINYRAPGYNESFTVEGNGKRTVEVEFNYF